MEFRQHYLPSEAIQENGHHRIGAVSSYNWHINQEITLIMGGDAEWTEGGLTQTQEKSMKLLR
jgi:iron complex outermembrane receptor protein